MIAIKNIYHMLAYAFRVLSERGYVNISPESFENTTNLLSAILDKGVTQLIKQGIRSDYIPTIENTGSPVGKINLAESIKSQYTVTHRLVCEHELFVPDIFLNQIIKATLTIATHAKEVDPNIQKSLRRNAFYFHDVSDINPRTIRWSDIRYDRNNASYKMLVNICYLLITGLLQCEDENGHMQVANIIDDQKMHRLYERFILEYYKRHYPMLQVSAAHIPWDSNDEDIAFLPTMKSDVTIRYENTEYCTFEQSRICFRRNGILFRINKQYFPKPTYAIDIDTSNFKHIDLHMQAHIRDKYPAPHRYPFRA